MQILLIGIRDSPDHSSVRNEEVRIKESPYYRGFFNENIWEFCRDIGNCL